MTLSLILVLNQSAHARKSLKHTYSLHINYMQRLKYAGYQLCLLINKTGIKFLENEIF